MTLHDAGTAKMSGEIKCCIFLVSLKSSILCSDRPLYKH
uniref:Uncharacterized protein n=1 Tax=Rhizophora mucronata TaxID=61149 RepID=A0A2P2PSM2_RHIMU